MKTRQELESAAKGELNAFPLQKNPLAFLPPPAIIFHFLSIFYSGLALIFSALDNNG